MKETKKTNNKKGVSLIVLVITIIIMIILAATVIISLSNSGIIGKANEAVEQTNLKQVQTIAQTIWAESQLTKDNPATIKSKIIAAIGGETVASKYDIDVTETGVTVEIATNSGEDDDTDDDDNEEDNEGNEGNQGNEGGNDNNTNEGNTEGLPIIWEAGTDVTELVAATDSEGNVMAYKISDYDKPIESLEGKKLYISGGTYILSIEDGTLKSENANMYWVCDGIIISTQEGTIIDGITFTETGVYIPAYIESIPYIYICDENEKIPSIIETSLGVFWDGDTTGLEYTTVVTSKRKCKRGFEIL